MTVTLMRALTSLDSSATLRSRGKFSNATYAIYDANSITVGAVLGARADDTKWYFPTLRCEAPDTI